MPEGGDEHRAGGCSASVGLDAPLALPLRSAAGARPLAAPSGARNFIDSPLYGLFGIRSGLADATLPNTGELGGYWIRQPSDPVA